MRKVDVFVKGPGSGRETAIRSLQATGLEVGSISDVHARALQRNPSVQASAASDRAHRIGDITTWRVIQTPTASGAAARR